MENLKERHADVSVLKNKQTHPLNNLLSLFKK